MRVMDKRGVVHLVAIVVIIVAVVIIAMGVFNTNNSATGGAITGWQIKGGGPPPCSLSPLCSDSDGTDIFTKGTTIYNELVYCQQSTLVDGCIDSSTVVEFSCNSNTLVASDINCLNGCINGACVDIGFDFKSDGDLVIYIETDLKDSTENINVLFGDGNRFTGVGEDVDKRLGISNNNLLFINRSHKWFIASWTSPSGIGSESYLMRTTNFKDVFSGNKTTFQYRKNGQWVDAAVDKKAGDAITIGNMQFILHNVNKTSKAVNISAGTNVDFRSLHSKNGYTTILPVSNSNDGIYIREMIFDVWKGNSLVGRWRAYWQNGIAKINKI